MSNSSDFETGCCPRFNQEPWQEKEIKFNNKLFIKDHVNSLFHLPLNFGSVMKKNMKVIENAGAKTKDNLVLSDEKSSWGTDVYIEIEKKVPATEIATLSGTFLTKVFEGPFKNMGTYIGQMQSYVKSKGKEIKKNYFYYPYCPKCAKAYGNNYVVILSQI